MIVTFTRTQVGDAAWPEQAEVRLGKVEEEVFARGDARWLPVACARWALPAPAPAPYHDGPSSLLIGATTSACEDATK